VVSDADISAGDLLDSNGRPKYPILISLAAEAVRDDEIAQLNNYVAAGDLYCAARRPLLATPMAPRGMILLSPTRWAFTWSGRA